MLSFPQQDSKQKIRLRRCLYAQAGAVLHSLLCYLLMNMGYFRTNWREFFQMLGAYWLINLIFPLLIHLGVNKRFKDPSLTLPQMLWATTVVMISLYFVYNLRSVILMYYLITLVFGAFRLHLASYLMVAGGAITGYGLVIYCIIYNQVEVINPRLELMQWLSFAMVAVAIAILGADLSRLRRRFSRQNRELHKALDRINELAITDELTGLYNRRHIMDVLEYQKALADRGGHSFVIVFVDLDHFKRINDTFGHSVGDLVLMKFAQTTSAIIREVDYISRFGGEEFVMVLVGATLQDAAKVAERVRKQMEIFSFGDIAPKLKITASLGATPYLPGESINVLLARADEALYQSKSQGRNRTVIMERPAGRPSGPAPAVVQD